MVGTIYLPCPVNGATSQFWQAGGAFSLAPFSGGRQRKQRRVSRELAMAARTELAGRIGPDPEAGGSGGLW